MEDIIVPGRSQHRWDLIIGLALALLAMVWRLYFSLGVGLPVGDEVNAVVTAFQILQHPGFVPFQAGQAYMGTIQEYVTAVLMILMGIKEMTLRLPAAIFFAAAVFVAYNTISKEISREDALASSILMVAGNSAVVIYTGAFAYPDYAVAIFLAAAIAWQTFRVDRSRTPAQWLLLGMLAGIGAYLFQILILQTTASLIFLALRSPLFHRLKTVARDWGFWTMVACAAVSCVLLLSVAYHYLTRRETYVATYLDLMLLFGGLILAGAFVILLVNVLKPSRANLVAIGSFSTVFVIFQALPNLWFRYRILPTLAADHVPLWQGGTYSLKHIHEWGRNACLLFNRVLPHLFAGRIGSFPDLDVSKPCPINTVGILSAAGAMLCMALLFHHFRAPKRLMLARPESVFILPLLMLILVLFPSWRLFGAGSYRYMLIFVPGISLCVVVAVRVIANSSWAILFGFVAAYALYAGYDCLANRQLVLPDKKCVSIAAQLLDRKIDGALVSGKCTAALVWRTAGRLWVADANAGISYLYPRLSRIAVAESIAAVNLNETIVAHVLGANAKDFVSVDTLSPTVVVYRRKHSRKTKMQNSH